MYCKVFIEVTKTIADVLQDLYRSHCCSFSIGRKKSVFSLSVLLANTSSLAPMIDEVRSVTLDLKPRFFTETYS